ncbi:hypothetical protein D9M68_592090 [compost metagenome]
MVSNMGTSTCCPCPLAARATSADAIAPARYTPQSLSVNSMGTKPGSPYMRACKPDTPLMPWITSS